MTKRALLFSLKFVLFSLAFSAAALIGAFIFRSCCGNNDRLEKYTSFDGGDDVFIVIDAGHGGMDGGASSADGISESGLNLDVAKRLRDICTVLGKNAVMTREEDIMLSDGGSGSRKGRDLRRRLDIAKENPGAVFVSIHMNKFPDEDCRGLQVWYSPNSSESSYIASNIQLRSKELLDSENNRTVKAATSSIYLLDRIQTPAVLVECGFLSNQAEARLLNDSDYQLKLAVVILSGIFDSISSD